MYYANQDLLEGFSILKLRGGGDDSIWFTAFAFKKATLAAEAYLSRVVTWADMEQQSINSFEELGATSKDITTFQYNDGKQSAVSRQWPEVYD